MKKKIFFIIMLLLPLSIFPQIHVSSQGHQDEVSAILPVSSENDIEKSYFSVGKDGFLIKWLNETDGEHYQISDLELKMAAISPNGKEIAVYETDGGAINRISIWNWDTLTKKASRSFSDTITSLAYSANGTYIIAGTSTVDGAVFIRNTGFIENKIKEPTGVVSYVTTSKSEKTAAMYSPAGHLSFYNLVTGRLKNKYIVETSLSQSVLFNNFLFLAGVKDDEIYIIYALTGKTISKIPAQDPIILSSSDEENLYYLEHTGRGDYSLKMLENIENKRFSNPRILKNFKGPRNTEAIICGTKSANEIMLASKSGAIYKIDDSIQTALQIFTPISKSEYDKILDMSPFGEEFYFLTKNSLYKSSYETGMVSRLGDNPGQTHLITYGNKVILWSKDSLNPVQLFDYAKPELKTLFTPKSTLQSVRLFGNSIVEMESNSSVNFYDMEEKVLKHVYTGAGLQDAVIGSNGNIFVAKSFATNPKSALLSVDFKTGETVPMPLAGNVSFGLSVTGNELYGVCVRAEGSSNKTVIFRYNTSTRTASNILILPGEDADAFTYMHSPHLYTNIGKNNVRCINLRENKNYVLKRSASIPMKVSQNASNIVILNRDGSISWYNINSSAILEDWYLRKDGQWFAY